MKKNLLVFLIMLIFACLCLYATDSLGSAAGSGNTDGSAYVPVSFNLSGGENGEWEVGFTSVIPQGGLTASSVVTPLDSDDIKLTYGGTAGNQGVLEEDKPVYVYWIIKGNPGIKISLSTGGVMTGDTENTNKINWKVSEKVSGQAESSFTIGTDAVYTTGSDPTSYTTALLHTNNKTIDVGSVSLDIITQDITDATADSYTGKLILTIEATESSATTEETV